MPQVLLGQETYQVDDDLYRDFLDEYIIEGKTFQQIFTDYKIDTKTLEDYIIYRLLEVDPGFAPKIGLA